MTDWLDRDSGTVALCLVALGLEPERAFRFAEIVAPRLMGRDLAVAVSMEDLKAIAEAWRG
jgi:hypothetical protein